MESKRDKKLRELWEKALYDYSMELDSALLENNVDHEYLTTLLENAKEDYKEYMKVISLRRGKQLWDFIHKRTRCF